MGFKEKFQKLPDSTKVRAFFHPLALAATQLVSVSHYLFIPMSVIAGLILGGAIAVTAEIVNRFLSKKERIMRESEKIIKYATNPLKAHLYVAEILPDGEIVYRFANNAYSKRPNRALSEGLVGRKYSESHTPEESAAYYNHLVEVIKAGKPFEDEHISESGRYAKRILTPYIDTEAGKKYVTVLSQDIRQLKELQKQLTDAAYHDTLTGLANRRLLADRVKLAKADMDRTRHDGGEANCIGILKMDLDNFKYCNDTHGHAVGDELLVAVAKRLVECVRNIDTVAREGGDEFTLLLSNTTQEGAIVVAKKVIAALNRPYSINNIECCVGVSIGISFYPQDGTAFEELHKRADQALYVAKESGKNTYRVFDEVKDNISLAKGSLVRGT